MFVHRCLNSAKEGEIVLIRLMVEQKMEAVK